MRASNVVSRYLRDRAQVLQYPAHAYATTPIMEVAIASIQDTT